MKTAIAAVMVASFSLMVATISCVIAAKNYKKSKRLEFFQRRDQLLLRISELNARNSETRLSGARFTTVATEKAALTVPKKYEERNALLVAGMRTLAAKIQSSAEYWDKQIEGFHSICGRFTPEKNTTHVENLIATVQLASDRTKATNEVYLSSLHIVETTHEKMEIDLAEMRKMEIQLAELEQVMKLNESAPKETRDV